MIKLNLVTPEKKVFVDFPVKEITVPTLNGQRNILDGHVPMISLLGTGVLKVKNSNGDLQSFVISSGFCEISPDGVSVLAEFVQTKEEMNLEQAKTKSATQSKKLATDIMSDDEFNRTVEEFQKAQAEIQILS